MTPAGAVNWRNLACLATLFRLCRKKPNPLSIKTCQTTDEAVSLFRTGDCMIRLLSCLLLITSLPYGLSGQSLIKIQPKNHQDLEIIIRTKGATSSPSNISQDKQMRSPFEAASNTPPVAVNREMGDREIQNSPYVLLGGGSASLPARKSKPELTIAVTNQGLKQISAIHWQIVLNDTHCGNYCVVQSFRTKKRLAPKQSIVLAKWKESKSTPFEIQEAIRFGRFIWHVEIKEVQYEP
jgi:hypothetical protein